MIKDVIKHLHKASVRPNDFSSRYSALLDRLWKRKDCEVRSRTSTHDPSGTTISGNIGLSDGTAECATSSGKHVGWFYGQQDEFSWLDLQAVGELVSGEQGLDSVEGYGQPLNIGGWDWSDFGIFEGEEPNRLF